MGESIMELTSFDKSLLNLLQGNLPVCSRPFAALAEKLGTTEEHVLERLQVLKKEGYLRRIGTFFNSARLGYKGTLVALRVDPDKMKAVAEAINRYPGATHNYEREGRYNLWFTLLTPALDKEREILKEVKALPGVESMLNLKAQKKYKINVQFKLA
ncbi:siroheme decarboxylase subunit alpha [Mitsuokella sp.]|uniref:siroheme decarboxylase subunit alpha n=2 Tax=Mitsuokella TaxID=52225 RepID=UPI003D7CC73C